jgi:hypothetical protein
MTTKYLIDQFRRTGYVAMDLVEDRITDDPDSVSVKDAAIVAGIATDKIAKKERWGQGEQDGPSLGESLLAVAERILGSPGKLDIHITAGSAQASDPLEGARDVTPRSGGEALAERSDR